MVKKIKIKYKNKITLYNLKEIGLDDSRTMRSLKKKCLRISQDICLSMPGDTELPEGYMIIIKPNTTNDPGFRKTPVLVNIKKHITLAEPLTRNMVLFFTKDLADRLLDKFENFLKESQNPCP